MILHCHATIVRKHLHYGHSTSNEQIFRNPHALRPRILLKKLVGCPIIQTRRAPVEGKSFSVSDMYDI